MKTTARMLCLAALVTALTLTSGCSSKESKQPVSTVTDPPAAAQTTAAATEEAKAEATNEPEKQAEESKPLNDDTSVSTIEVDDNGWIALACGNDYVMALQKDGTLCGWGRNTYGQVGSATYKEPDVKAVQPVLEHIASFATGEQHTAAIDENGVLYIWGSNHSGRLGDGTTAGRTAPYQNATLLALGKKAVSAVPGMNCTLVLLEDGTLYGFGSNSKGQLGVEGSQFTLPVEVLTDVKAAFTNGEFSFAIKNDGTVWATGSNKRGQLGTGDTESLTAWTQVKAPENVKTFALGEEFSLALTEDGAVWAAGSNKRGQLGLGVDDASVAAWTKVADGAEQIFAGVETAGMLKTDGTLWLWGGNKYGQVGDGTAENRNAPVKVMDDVQSADIGDAHAAALKKDGSIWVWGYNKYFQLCDGTNADSLSPRQVVTH